MKKISSRWFGLASILLGLLAWDLVARLGNLPAFILPSPGDVWMRLLKAVRDGSLFVHAGVTLLEIMLGLVCGVLLATVLGYLVARSRTLERALLSLIHI